MRTQLAAETSNLIVNRCSVVHLTASMANDLFRSEARPLECISAGMIDELIALNWPLAIFGQRPKS